MHAHPDDETIGTGATMAKYAAQGAQVDRGERFLMNEVDHGEGVVGAETIVGNVGSQPIRRRNDFMRVFADRDPGNVTEVLLVLDATTGQNGLMQARQFADAVDVTGIVLTKLDGTAKGGIVIAVERELFVPVKLVGLGEGPDDLVDFDSEAFVDALLASD